MASASSTAVQGIGDLGHLAIQSANRFGYRVAAIVCGSQNSALAIQLGASMYIDSQSVNGAEALQQLGAQVILATARSSKSDVGVDRWSGAERQPMVVG